MQNEKKAQWVTTKAERQDTVAIRYRMSGQLPSAFHIATLRVIASDLYRLWLNGQPVGISDDWQGDNWQVTGIAKPGLNVVEAEVRTRMPEVSNCWLYLDKQLPTPTPLSQLDFTVTDAKLNEWIYVQFIDADGRQSGYTCQETGRSDLMFDTSGSPRVIRINPLTEKQLAPNAAFDWQRVRTIRLRIDRKQALPNPKGELSFSDVRVNGNPVAMDNWTATPGVGPLSSILSSDSPNELRLSYDFTPRMEASFLCELAVADQHGAKLVQLLSDDKTTTDQGIPQLMQSGFFTEWMAYLPSRVGDMLDEGAAPNREYLYVSTTESKELFKQGLPIELGVAIYGFDAIKNPVVRLQLDEWNHPRVWNQSVTCKPSGTGQVSATIALPKLREGVYRVTAWNGSNLVATAAFAVLPVGQTTISPLLSKLKPYTRRKQMLGVNDTSWSVQHPGSLWSLREMDINLLVAHIGPSETETGVTDDLCAYCKATGTHFTFNVEAPNFAAVSNSTNGKNSFDAPDGCHRWDVDADTLHKAAATGVFEGVTYDESEHMQLSRNGYSHLPEPNRKPFYVETTGLSLHDAYTTFKQAISRLVKRNSQYGARMQVESVFPVLWHPMAEGGMTIAPKLLKEDVHPVVFAEALGAAIQHNAPLWFSPDLWCPDLWGYAEMPGHSARELQMAIRACHLAGVDTLYVEFAPKLYSLNGNSYRLTRHGKVMKDHITQWIPAHRRNYSYRDYQPEVAIVRFPDSDWGQSSVLYWDNLYGALNLHSSPETREHMQVWSLLTDGVLNGRAVNFNGEPVAAFRAPQPWRFAVPSPAVAVYDHNVGAKHLKGVGVIFACGYELSEQTLSALRSSVKAGAVCFISAHLAPKDLQPLGGASSVRLPEGKGSWIIMSSFTHDVMAPYRQLLQKTDGSMWLRFKNQRVKLG